MPDATLAAALKQAKGKKMFFAFVPKGSDGKLIISKTKIAPKQIAEAKKEIGGGTPVTGKCFGDGATMVFQVAKPAPATLGPALKKVAKRDTGLTIDPEFRLASDADAEEETTGAAPAGAGAPAAAAVAPKAPPAAAPKAAPNLGPWQAARQDALNELKALATKIAATKHETAGGIIKEIGAIITKLPANPAPSQIDNLEDFVRHDDTITAAEECPSHFHAVNIREPVPSPCQGKPGSSH
jgi:hypothetical protein